ncbi:hypothetical protein IWQ61_010540 [Dispira simplex]|nr:hypothetical protein IWQ61_010540 [Dispira simplex]
MKINILTVAPLALTALLVTGSPVDTISDKDPVGHLLFFSNVFGGDIKRDIDSDKKARTLLRDKEIVKGMLNVANDVENKVSEESDQRIVTEFLVSDIGREFKKDLNEIIDDDKTISVREAKISLLFLAKFHPIDPYRFLDLENNFSKFYYPTEVVKEMLEIAKDVKNKVSDKSVQETITNFLDSDIAQEFKNDLAENSTNGGEPISDKEAIWAFLYFYRIYDDEYYQYTVYNKEALRRLNSKKMAEAMLKIANVIGKKNEKFVKDGIVEQYFIDEIAEFLSCDRGIAFKEHLLKVSMDDNGNISEKAKDALLFFAGFYDDVKHPHYFLDEEIKERLYSWEMANAMFKVTNEAYKKIREEANDAETNALEESDDAETNVPEESDEDMITEFLKSGYGASLLDDLDRIADDSNEFLANYEFLQGLKPRKSATTKVTLMQLYFIANTQGNRLFSNEEFLAAVRCLDEDTNPCFSTLDDEKKWKIALDNKVSKWSRNVVLETE